MPIPIEVRNEFEQSLQTDIANWSKEIAEHIDSYNANGVAKAGTGVMVAFMLPTELAQTLALPGGEAPEELHITIAYLGKDMPEWQTTTVARVLANLASQQTPLTGEIAGVGVFPASESTEGRQVLVRLVDVPYLESFREKLLNALANLGIPVVRNHGYTPHVTLKYTETVDVAELAALLVNHPIVINHLTLAVAGVHQQFKLLGKTTAVKFGWEDF